MKIKKNAVLYMRMSTDMQEHSIKSQERVLLEYANRNDYTIIRNYIDEGISGQHATSRPGFMQMIDDSDRKEFEYVLIYDSSRFARNLVDSLTYKSILKQNGVRLISITEPNTDDDEMSLYIDALQGAANEIYVRKLSKSVKRGHHDRALRGDYTGDCSMGFKRLPDKTVILDDDEAAIIRYMYEAIYYEDATYFSIAETLSLKGIKSKRGNLIDSRQVKRMLQNIKNKGCNRIFKDGEPVIIKGKFPPIVSDELFDGVQDIIKKREGQYKKYEKPTEMRKHWLSGLLICPFCGGGYNYNSHGKSTRKPQFRCGNQTRGACKLGSSIVVEIVEQMVLNELSKAYKGPLLPYVPHITIVKPEPIIDYNHEIRLLEAQLKRAKKAFLSGIDSMEEYAQNKKLINENISELKSAYIESEKSTILNEEQFKEKILNIITLLKSEAPMSEKIPAARSIIEKILIDPRNKNMEIYFFA